MDQRAKGGTPPTASTAKPGTPPTRRCSSTEEPQRDRAGEKKRSREKEVVENGEAGKEEEEERRGAGRSGPGGDKGEVLELLIEGRCGDTGQRPLLFPGATAPTEGPEANVRLRIGLQAKRTKKPPKMLESYVCKPTFRTYQRQGRAEAQRGGGGDGGAAQQGIASPTPPGETVREQSSVLLDTVQPQAQQTALSAPSPPSSSSRSLQRPPLSSTALLASAPASPGTGTDREVSIKASGKTEVNANAPPEKAMRDKLPGISAHSPVTSANKSCSLKTDQSISSTAHPSTTLSAATTSAGEPRNEGETHSKHNGLGRQKRPANGKGPLDGCSHARTSKSSTPNNKAPAARLPTVSSNSHKELCRFQENRTDSVCSPSVDPKPPSTSSPPSQLFSGSCDTTQDPPLLDKKREKKAKRGNRKEKKYKRDRGEAEGAKSEGGRREEGKKKKKEKEKDRKSRHGKGKEERGRNHGTKREGAENTDRGKIERKRDKLSPESHRGKDKRDEPCEIDDVAKQDRVRKLAIPGEREKVEETTNKTVKEAESAAAGDDTKSKEQYVPLRRQPISPSRRSPPPPSPPLSPSPPAACSLASASTAPQEQDSRPLKKRKARRPSWTKLVHRVQRAENQEAPSDSCHNSFLSLPEKIKTCPSRTKSPDQPTDLAHITTSSSSSSLPTSSPHPAPCRPSSPVHSVSQRHSPSYPVTPARKRGRPKSHTEQLTPRSSPEAATEEAPRPACEGAPKAPSPETTPSLQGAAQPNSTPRKRGRPPKRPLPEDPCGDRPSLSEGKGKYKGFNAERGIRQLKIRKLISEIKKKRKRLHTGMRSEYGRRRVTRGEAECEGAPAACRPQEATVNTLSALSPLGDKWGAQINVSKRGTIYMGKRRGRKPKAPAGTLNSPLNAHRPPQPPLFTSLSESSLFASHQLQPPAAHPFPSPSLTHSSGAQSPYSEGSFTDPTSTSSSLVFPHPFSLPSPSSSCTSPHPPPPTSSSSLSPFVKKSCPCQGRLHFPFHQSSCKLSALAPPLHHSPTSPAHLKEAIPSPRSESHSEETLPSDSGIGTDNNSVSERGGEMRGGRGVFRMGPGSGLILGGQRYPTALAKRPSPVASHLASVHRHAHPIASPAAVERQRERHRHRRRDFDCVSSCSCMCSCPCQGPNKCTHVDSYPCLGHSAMKKQKSKHKKKHQQLHMHDPEFLAELEDLIGQFGEVHIGRRGWVRSGLGPGLEGGVKVDGGRRHHPSSSHPMRSNIFRINLNGFYSPHSSAYSTNPSYGPQPFYPCQPLHCGRKPDRRQCGCPSKFQDTMDDMSFYRGYPPTVPIYPHLHSSYPLPPPHQYVSHQPHHPHFLLNPARFHRRMGRVMRDGGPGAEGEGDVGRAGGGGGGQRPGAGFASALGCGCSRAEHKHKRKHRHHQRCDPNEEEEDAEEEEGMPGDPGLAGPKPQPGGYVPGPADGGRKAQRDSPWLRKNVRETFSSTATGMTSLPRLSSERFKQTPLTSLGLGSSHLSSFGGSWGGLGQPWMKIGASGHPGFSLSNPSWSTSASSKHAERSEGSDPEEEDDDEDEYQDSHLYAAPRSPTHINLFTSAAMETGRKGLRIGKEGPGVGEMSWRREDLAWRERRGTGLQGDPRRRGTQKGVPAAAAAAAVAAATDGAEVRKRGPGRPRKYPLPVPAPPSSLSSSSPPPPPPSLSSSSSSTYPFTAPLQSPEAARSRIDVVGERLAEGTAAQTGDSGLAAGAKRKRGRKRKHADSPCRRSLSDDKPDSDDPAEYFDQSETEQLSPHTSSVQWERRVDSYPSKSFLNSGLYSDDHKTTDSPTESNPTSRASVEYTAGEREYSLLPAPLHVGKYLRLKRIDFQLPYDVLWLWRHNQLHRQPAVPLKRKRHYCRLKGRTRVSHHELEECSGDMAALFPHLEMEPMTSTERSFVVKQRVFLVRNWEAVRDKQIHLRMERERRRQRAESDAAHRARSGDHGNIQSDEPLGSDEMVISRVPHSRTSDTSSSLTAYPHLTKPQNRREETGEEDKTQEEEDEDEEEEEEEEEEDNEVCRRELRKKRLNDLLLALQHP